MSGTSALKGHSEICPGPSPCEDAVGRQSSKNQASGSN